MGTRSSTGASGQGCYRRNGNKATVVGRDKPSGGRGLNCCGVGCCWLDVGWMEVAGDLDYLCGGISKKLTRYCVIRYTCVYVAHMSRRCDLRRAASLDARVALLRGFLSARPSVRPSHFVRSWFLSACFHPPPCHPLCARLARRPSQMGQMGQMDGSLRTIRANHASANPVPTSTQPLVLPSQPVFYHTLICSFISQARLPTERTAQRRAGAW